MNCRVFFTPVDLTSFPTYEKVVGGKLMDFGTIKVILLYIYIYTLSPLSVCRSFRNCMLNVGFTFFLGFSFRGDIGGKKKRQNSCTSQFRKEDYHCYRELLSPNSYFFFI